MGAAASEPAGEAPDLVGVEVDVVVQPLILTVGGSVVELVGDPSAGHRDIPPFAIQGLGAQRVGVVAGQPLGFVPGDGVAVCDVSCVEVAGRQGQLHAAVVERVDGPLGWVDAGDGGAGAVDDVEPAVVS